MAQRISFLLVAPLIFQILCRSTVSGNRCNVDPGTEEFEPEDEPCYSDLPDANFTDWRQPKNLREETETDWKAMKDNNQHIKGYFEEIGSEYCIHPAILAAIASKERHVDHENSRQLIKCSTKDTAECYRKVTKGDMEGVVRSELKPKIDEFTVKYVCPGASGWYADKLLQAAVHSWHYNIDVDTYPGKFSLDFTYDVFTRALHLAQIWHRTCTDGLKDAKTDCKKMLEYIHCRKAERCFTVDTKRFSEHACVMMNGLHSLSKEGKEFLSSALACVMLEEAERVDDPLYDEATVEQISSKQYSRCFMRNGTGLCPQSRDTVFSLKMIITAYQGNNQSKDFIIAQLQEVIDICYGTRSKRSLEPYQKDASLSPTFNDLYMDSPVKANTGINYTCSTYADNGNCLFYECFDKRFPCDSEEFDSHQVYFEAANCVTNTESARHLRNPNITLLVTNYHKCMARVLKPFYLQSSVQSLCSTVRADLMDHRTNCLLEANFCSLHQSNRTALEYFLLLTASMEGYPGKVPRKQVTLPLANRPVGLPVYYFQQLTFLWRAVMDALVRCRGTGPLDPLYSKTLLMNSAGETVTYFRALY